MPTITTPPKATEALKPVAARLLWTERYLHRVDRSQTVVMVVRSFETAAGEQYHRLSQELWKGL